MQCLRGDTVHLGNVSPTRDLNYVENIVDGFLKASECEQAVGKTINLGSGREISIRDLASLIGQSMGKTITIECEDQRIRPENSEVERLLADYETARRLLGWEPRISLEEGLQNTIAWIRENADKYRSLGYVI